MKDEDQTIAYAAPKLWTSRCFACDTIFEGPTQTDVRTRLEQHQVETGHRRSYAIVVSRSETPTP